MSTITSSSNSGRDTLAPLAAVTPQWWQDQAIRPARQVMRPWQMRDVAFISADEAREWEALHHLYQRDMPRSLYLCGANAALPREWFMAPADCQEWRVWGYSADPRRADYESLTTGRRHTIYAATSWFGDETDAGACRSAWDYLAKLMSMHFGKHAHPMGTPARTGIDLLERSLPTRRDGSPYEYPVLDPQLRSFFHHNGGQGHFEYVGDARGYVPYAWDTSATLRLLWLDARWMYAACVRHLPVGPWTIDDQPDYAGPYQWGMYDITWRVPSDWPMAGLLPIRGEADDGTPTSVWPRTGTHRAWVGAAQLAVALDAGWSVTIHQRLLAAPQSTPGSDPARTWLERLQTCRQVADGHAAQGSKAARLASAAIRHLLIDAVGAWSRDSRWELHAVPANQGHLIPSSWAHTARLDDTNPNILVYEAPTHIARDQQPMMHPEWSVCVWDRARAKLMQAYLRYHEELHGRVLWLRSDAMVVDGDPMWKDTQRVGAFRVKRTQAHTGPVPTDEAGYRRMLGEGRRRDAAGACEDDEEGEEYGH